MKTKFTKSEDRIFYASCCAMTGLLAKYNLNKPEDQGILCRMAIELAKELDDQLQNSRMSINNVDGKLS